jgi:hypothetical protein
MGPMVICWVLRSFTTWPSVGLTMANRILSFVRDILALLRPMRSGRGRFADLTSAAHVTHTETLSAGRAKMARRFPSGGKIILLEGRDCAFVLVTAGKRRHLLFMRHDHAVIEAGATATIELVAAGPRSRAEEALFGGPPQPSARIGFVVSVSRAYHELFLLGLEGRQFRPGRGETM